VALFSGMLDSILAVHLVRQQGIEVRGIYFQSPFLDRRAWVTSAAARLAMPLEIVELASDYVHRLRYPGFGWGRGANACIDCRLAWLERAADQIDRGAADFVITGEVLGQKAFGQKRRDLLRLSDHSRIGDRLVRPLSAQRLPATLVERRGWLVRARLKDFAGSRRAELLGWGAQLGWSDAPSCGNCCRLVEPGYATKVRDLWRYANQPTDWDYRLLNGGRHFRLGPTAKLVVAHNQAESIWLAAMHAAPDATASLLLEPDNFRGPAALLVGSPLPDYCRLAWGLILRYTPRKPDRPTGWTCQRPGARVVAPWLDNLPAVEHLQSIAVRCGQ
jgi:hypothetical protein